MDISDLAILSVPVSRVLDCLEKGIRAVASPYVYKRLERAKMEIVRERADQNALISLKEALAADLIKEARTTRDKQEIANISAIYSLAIQELQAVNDLALPDKLVSTEWTSHFYDSAKYCSDEEVQMLWAKILAGEIREPGKYYKRTLANLKLIERHEAEWFTKMCKYTMEGAYFPRFVLEDETIPFNEYQSLVDCGFLNAEEGNLEISKDEIIPLKSKRLDVKLVGQAFNMPVITLTDTGVQICELVDTDAEGEFVQKLVKMMNDSKMVDVSVIE